MIDDPTDLVFDEPIFPEDDLQGIMELDDSEAEEDDEMDEILPLDDEEDEAYVTDEEFEVIARQFAEE